MKTASFILPMLLLAAALIATACESAPPDDASQNSAIAAAAPTATAAPQHTPTPSPTQTPTQIAATQTPTQIAATQTPTQIAATQTPTATPDPLNPPTPQPCPPGEIPVPITVRDGIVYMPDPPCFRLTSPTPLAYPKLAGSLSKVAELYESGASAQSAAMAAFLDDELREGSFFLKITIDREPRELVIWLNDNGAEFGYVNGTYMVDEGWPARNNTTIDAEYGIILLSEYLRGEAEPEEPYEGGLAYVGARVPVPLLVRLSEQPGVLKVEVPFRLPAPQQTDVPPEPQEPQDPVTPTPTPQATSQGLSKYGVTSWHQAGYKGRGVKIGIIATGFEGFRWDGPGNETSPYSNSPLNGVATAVTGMTVHEVVDRLKAGDPPIWTRVRDWEDCVTIHTFGLSEGEEHIVGERIADLFR